MATSGDFMNKGINRLDSKEAGKVWTNISRYETAMSLAWQKECLQNRSFYEGYQYTPEEEEVLAGRGQYNIVINKIRKAIKGMSGLVSASIPKYKLTPRGSEDEVRAVVGNKLLDYIWDNSNGLYTYRDIVKTALVDNIAYFHVLVDRKGILKFVKLGYDDVMVDPLSKCPMFSDAEMIIIRKYVPIERVEHLFGIKLDKEIPTGMFEMNTIKASNKQQEFLMKVYDSYNRFVNVYECYKKEYTTGSQTPKIVKETILGYSHIYREELPDGIEDFPIIPVYVEGHDNPYKRGEVHYLKEMQRFMNKVYGVTVLNAQILSQPKIFVNERSVPRGDMARFKEDYNKPGSINMLAGDSEPPVVIQGQPLNNAFFTLYQDIKQEFEMATLPKELLGYNNEGKNQQNSSVLDMKESTLDSMQDFLSIIEQSCTQLGRVCLQYAQGYLSKNTMINITDSRGKLERLELNRKEGLDVDDDRSVQQYIASLQQQEVPEEEIQEMLAKAKEDKEYMESLTYVINETNFQQFDVRVVAGSYSPSYEMGMLRLMMELLQTGAIDPTIVLEYAPVDDKERLIERFDTIKQLNGRVGQLEEENEILRKNTADANREIVSVRNDADVAKNKTKLDKIADQARITKMRDKMLAMLQSKEDKIKFMELYKRIELEQEKQNMKAMFDERNDRVEATKEPTIDEILDGRNI